MGSVASIAAIAARRDGNPARINIDIKAPGAVVPLWETIRRHAAYDRVCVGSFGERRLHAFRRLAGARVATAAGQLGTAALRYAPGRLSTLAHSPGQVLQIPTTHEVRGRTFPLVTPGLIAAAHRFGLQVHVWTIDDPDDAEALVTAGVTGIITDVPDVISDALAA